MTILKASTKFKRSAKIRRQRMAEERAERELEQAGSIWSEMRQLEQDVVETANAGPAAAGISASLQLLRAAV